MMTMNRQSVMALLLILGVTIFSCEAFAPATSVLQSRGVSQFTSTQKAGFVPSSSLDISASTLDPTTVLSDLFSGLLNGPAILAVPIVAALGVVGLIAWIIVSYASPVVEDDEQ